jgi:hypothetical protein
MTWTRRSVQIAATVAVVAAWAVFSVVVVRAIPLFYDPVTESFATVDRRSALLLAVPTALWVAAARIVVHHWWSRNGIHLATTDGPGRLLAVAVATLPKYRREWGAAMIAELAEVHGRQARWRFALSAARAALWMPHALRLRVPDHLRISVPTLAVTSGVVSAITITVIFLRHDPAAAGHLRLAGGAFLAAVLAGCLWIAVVRPPSLGTGRLAPFAGVGVALVYVVGLLLLIRAVHNPQIADGLGDSVMVPAGQTVAALAWSWFVFGLAVACFLAALVGGLIDRSFRAGLQAGIWTAITILPLAYAVWLHEALRLYPANGGLLFFGDVASEGENLGAALTWVLGVPPALGLPFLVIGAALASRVTRRVTRRTSTTISR